MYIKKKNAKRRMSSSLHNCLPHNPLEKNPVADPQITP